MSYWTTPLSKLQYKRLLSHWSWIWWCDGGWSPPLPWLRIFRSARTSCRTFDFSTRPVHLSRPRQFFLSSEMSCNSTVRPQVPLKPYIFWKLMMSAIQIQTKIQIQRQIHRQIQIQRQIKGKPMTTMMWYIFEKEMTKGFWIWYATGRV